MKIIHRLEEYQRASRPVVLTIGNFDGVHRGHQKLIHQLTAYAHKIGGDSVVITFENHPSTLLNPDKPVELLCSHKHRMLLLEKLDVDVMASLWFSSEFANQSAETFLRSIVQNFPLSRLILGHDAKIGKGREGDRDRVVGLAKAMSFEVEYIDEFTNGSPISSSRIRQLIQKGSLDEEKKMLGREYSILTMAEPGIDRKVNLNVSGLCLPPVGAYVVEVRVRKEIFEGVASLTEGKEGKPCFELSLIKSLEEGLYGKEIEVIFRDYV